MKNMTSNHHEDEVFRKKRVVKNPIKFKTNLIKNRNENGLKLR